VNRGLTSIPGPRRVRVIALKVARRAEHHLATLAIEAIPESIREFWYEELFSAYGNSDSRLEWLGLPPYKRAIGALNEVVDKLVFLRILSVPMFATFDISLENLVELSQRCRSRRASKLKMLREPIRTLEIACFLRHTLLLTTDAILSLCDLRTTDLRRHAREQAEKLERTEQQNIRILVSRTRQFAEDSNRSDSEVRAFVLDTLPERYGKPVSRAFRYHEALAADRYRVRRLLRYLLTPRINCVERSKVKTLLALWDSRQGPKQQPLNDEEIGAVPERWRIHVTQQDSKKSIAAFDCVVLTEIRCALRKLSFHKSFSTLTRKYDLAGCCCSERLVTGKSCWRYMALCSLWAQHAVCQRSPR
jgi:hypothetical protein